MRSRPLDLISGFRLRFAFRAGEVLEWLIRPVSKTGKPQKGFVGSNPTLSAIMVPGSKFQVCSETWKLEPRTAPFVAR